MKNKRLLSFLTVACILAALCAALIPAVSAEAAVWNGVSGTSIAAGSGTSEDPYLIRDPAELDFIAASAVGGEKFEGKYFRLETDVDWGGREWTPIGTKAAPFGGVFDGNGKTVYNFTCTDSVPGFFGYATGAEIKKLKVDHAVFTTDTRYAGAIVGLLRESKLSSCAVGENVVVTTESMMSSTAQMGGVCGLVNNSTVTACVNYGKVEALNATGTSFVGGIAGVVGNESTLVNCMNVGSVSSPNKNVTEGSCAYVGGIAGGIGSSSKPGVLEGCVNTGEVSCVEYAGGVVGRIHVAGSALNNCSNLGAVRGGADMSGSVVGLANKEFTASGNMGLSGSAPAECANVAEGVAVPAGAWSAADEAAIKAIHKDRGRHSLAARICGGRSRRPCDRACHRTGDRACDGSRDSPCDRTRDKARDRAGDCRCHRAGRRVHVGVCRDRACQGRMRQLRCRRDADRGIVRRCSSCRTQEKLTST